MTMARRPNEALASLARAGVVITKHRSAEVAFEVHHIVDRAGYLFELYGDESQSPQDAALSLPGFADRNWESAAWARLTKTFDPFFETLSTASYGAGFVVRTAVRPVGADRDRRQRSSLLTDKAEVDTTSAQAWTFRGRAQPNPSFIYESTSALEGLIILDVEPRRLLVSHGQEFARIIVRISDLAVSASSPLLSLQSPAQLPPPSYTGESHSERQTDWARSSAMAVRFSIAIGRRSSEDRSSLASLLAQYCRSEGYGLQLRDTRIGHRSGNWFSIVQHHAPKVRNRIGSPGPRNLNVVNWTCPVTFVGPARVGSTRAIMRYLSTHTSASVVSVSVASIDDLAFIHLLLALPTGHRDAHVAARDGLFLWSGVEQDSDLGGSEITGKFQGLLVALGLQPPEVLPSEVAADLLARAGDYQMYAGPLINYNAPDSPSRSLWFGWDIERTVDGLVAPLDSLGQALTSMGLLSSPANVESQSAEANIEYLICRDVGNATLRAKGKIAVPDRAWQALLKTDDRSRAGTRMAQVLEESWQARLRATRVTRGDVTVAWREPWLSRGSSRI